MGLGLALLATAAMTAQTVTVVNHANVRPQVLQRVEQAVSTQVNGPLRRAWHTPRIRFGPGGWRLTLQYQISGCATPAMDAQGCHGYATDLTPYMVVATYGDGWTDGIPPQWGVALDHEIIEAVVSDHGGPEVCDPVETHLYQADDGTMLSAFVLPAYFRGNTTAFYWG